MPPPVIANVFRVTFEWNRQQGIKPVNVIHVEAAGATDDDIAGFVDAGFIAAGFPNNCFQPMVVGHTFDHITVQKLDGVSATSDHVLTHFQSGEANGEISPATAGVLSIKTAQRGARGRGRMFIGPLAEQRIVDGFIQAGVPATMEAGWDLFAAGMLAAGGQWVVASYKHLDAHAVTSLRMDLICGTQRRRQDQLR